MKNIVNVKGKQVVYRIYPDISTSVIEDDSPYGRSFIAFRVPDGKRFHIRHLAISGQTNAVQMVYMHQEVLIKNIHPAFVSPVEIVQQNGHCFLVSEFVESIDLKKLFRKYRFKGRKKEDFLFGVMIQIASALEALHKNGIIHGNLKPADILLETKFGKVNFEKPVVRLRGLALAKSFHYTPSEETKLPYTMLYSSPEAQLSLHQLICPASDLYNLGILFYEGLKGHHPFRQKHPGVVSEMHLRKEIKDYHGVHQGIANIIMKATHRKLLDKPTHYYNRVQLESFVNQGMDERFSSAKEFVDALERVKELPVSLSCPEYNQEKNTFSAHPVVLFDEYCVLCSGILKKLIRIDKREILRFAGMESEFATETIRRNKQKLTVDSVILFEGEKVYTRSDAFIRIMIHIGGWYQFYGLMKIIPRFIRNAVYNCIAKRRYSWWGRNDACFVPELNVKFRFINKESIE